MERFQANDLRAGQAAATEEIVAAAQARLPEAGFHLLSFRFSELVIVAPTER